MADKSSFTADEWKKLIEAPMLAAIAVTAADPSGLWGMLKEGIAASGALAKAKADAAADPLIKAIAAEYETAEGRSIARDGLKARLGGGKPAEATSNAVAALGALAPILDAKAPENAAAVRSWLAAISRAVAEGVEGRRRSRLRRSPGERCREGDARGGGLGTEGDSVS